MPANADRSDGSKKIIIYVLVAMVVGLIVVVLLYQFKVIEPFDQKEHLTGKKFATPPGTFGAYKAVALDPKPVPKPAPKPKTWVGGNLR